MKAVFRSNRKRHYAIPRPPRRAQAPIGTVAGATAATLAATRRPGRKTVGINLVVPDSLALFVKKTERLLEQAGLLRALGHRRVQDVQPVVVQVNRRECPRFIGVGELQLMPFDEIDVVPRVVGDLRARLLPVQLRGRVLNRPHRVDVGVHHPRVGLVLLDGRVPLA
jgi:hypothetical protein